MEPPAAPPIRTSFSLASIISACFGNGLNGIFKDSTFKNNNRETWEKQHVSCRIINNNRFDNASYFINCNFDDNQGDLDFKKFSNDNLNLISEKIISSEK